jgi:general secretion pathway protein I
MNGERQRGFTLIEVLVAFAIFAMTIGAIFGVLSDAARRGTQARERELRSLTAQSVLSELRARPAPWPVEERGRSQKGEAWELQVAPFDAASDERSAWRAYEVTVRVGLVPNDPARVTLRSIELAQVPR